MSANVEKMSWAYGSDTPWHKIGEEMMPGDEYNLDAVIEKSGLNWEVEKVPLITADTKLPVPDVFAVRRSTDKKILGNVGNRYNVLQNKHAFDWFQPFVESRDASFHTAGSLAEGSRI